MNKISDDDVRLLNEAIEIASNPPDDESVKDERSAEAFRDMLARGRALSEKQRAWATRVLNGTSRATFIVPDDWDIFHDY